MCGSGENRELGGIVSGFFSLYFTVKPLVLHSIQMKSATEILTERKKGTVIFPEAQMNIVKFLCGVTEILHGYGTLLWNMMILANIFI